MWSFAGAFPELAFDLAWELRATGRADLARELEGSTVKAVSYDPETDAGLVALEAQRGLNAVERNGDAQYASMQLDNFGRVVAIDLHSPPRELRWKLMRLTNSRW